MHDSSKAASAAFGGVRGKYVPSAHKTAILATKQK